MCNKIKALASISCTLLLILPITLSYAQAPNFLINGAGAFGGSKNEEFFAGNQCLDGGYLLTGLSYSKDGDINEPLVYDTANVFVVKCDSNGNKEWSRTFGGNLYDKARSGLQDTDSNFVITGTTHSIDGDFNASYGHSDIFILKLDPSGNKLWVKNYGGTGYESARYIMQTADGSYLIVGYTSSSNNDVPYHRGAHDGWILKLDSAGNVIWSKTYGGTGIDRIRYVIEMDDGGFVFSGSTSSSNMDLSINKGGFDLWIGKIDANGLLMWSNSYGGNGDDVGYHVSEGLYGTFLATGFTSSNNTGDLTNYRGGVTDGWIVRVDENGFLINQSCVGGTGSERLYRTYENSQGNVYTFGFSQSSDIDLNGVNFGTSNRYWLSSLNSGLSLLWGYCVGGTAGDFGKEFYINPVNNTFALMGDTKSNNGNVFGNHGNSDYWIAILEISSSLPPQPSSSVIQLFYDAQNSDFIINSPKITTAEIVVTDLSGKRIYISAGLKLQKGENVFDLEKMQMGASGIYIAEVIAVNVSGQKLKFYYSNK